MQFIAPKCALFVDSIRKAQTDFTYIFYNKTNGQLETHLVTHSFETIGKDFKKLNFDGIVRLAYSFTLRNKFSFQRAQIVLIALNKMHVKKITKQEKKWFIARKFENYLECIKNYRNGFGFCSSTHLYHQLIKELAAIPREAEKNSHIVYTECVSISSNEAIIHQQAKDKIFSSQAPQNLTVNLVPPKNNLPFKTSLDHLPLQPGNEKKSTENYLDHSKNTLSNDTLRPAIRTSTRASLTRATSEKFGKLGNRYLQATQSTGNILNSTSYAPPVLQRQTSRIQLYSQDYQNCDLNTKNHLFTDISVLAKIPHEPDPLCKKPTCMLDLLAVVGESKEIDLRNPKCTQVILDMFLFKSIDQQEQLVEWLKYEPTFELALLEKIFLTLYEKSRVNLKPVHFFSVYKLFDFYRKKYEANHSFDLTRPTQNKAIMTALSLMIHILPNDNKTIETAEWFCLQNPFNFDQFKIWMELFMNKKDPLSYFPARDCLIKKFMTENIDKETLCVKEEALDSYIKNVIHTF